MDKIEMYILKENIDSLLKGIDPQSHLPFGDDSVLKSQFNRDTLNKVSLILEYLIKVGMIPSLDSRVKFDFYLSKKQKQLIEISQEPISISKFVYNINELVDASVMKKLQATIVTKWLTNRGYLKITNNENGMEFKTLAEKSAELELICQEKTNKYGNKYSVILYPLKAQKFILDNLDEIVNSYYGSFEIPIE